MKIAYKFALGFGSVLVLLLAVSLTSLAGIHSLHQKVFRITQINNKEKQAALDLRASVTDITIAVRNVLLFESPSDKKVEEMRIQSQVTKYHESYAKLDRLFQTYGAEADERALFDSLRKNESEALPLFEKVASLVDHGDTQEAVKLLSHELREKQRAWVANLTALADVEGKQNEMLSDEANRSAERLTTVVSCAGLFAIVLGVFASMLTSKNLLRQLGGEPVVAMQLAQAIAAGDLSLRIDVDPRDTASLMASLERMRCQLNRIVGDIQRSGEIINAASSEIAQGSTHLAQRTEEQAAALEETAASMNQIAMTADQNTDNAEQGNLVASALAETARQNGRVVAEVVETMHGISESSEKMVQIIAVIEGIAFQTNILALNAAVEAARAGDQGRGFAVVAGEVRALAQRSASASKEIKALIEESTHRVSSGKERVTRAGGTVDALLSSVDKIVVIMQEVANGSKEQSSGAEQINTALSQMDSVTQQNAALVEQTSAAAQALAESGRTLREAVSVFVLDTKPLVQRSVSRDLGEHSVSLTAFA